MKTGPSKEGSEFIAELYFLVVLFLSQNISPHINDLIPAYRDSKIITLPTEIESREFGSIDPGGGLSFHKPNRFPKRLSRV